MFFTQDGIKRPLANLGLDPVSKKSSHGIALPNLKSGCAGSTGSCTSRSQKGQRGSPRKSGKKRSDDTDTIYAGCQVFSRSLSKIEVLLSVKGGFFVPFQ